MSCFQHSYKQVCNPIARWLTACLVIVITCTPLASAEPSKPPTVSPYVYNQLKHAEQQMAAGAFNDALITLDKILQSSGNSAYARALAQQSSGWVYYQTDQLNHAIKRFELAIALNALPTALEQHTRYNLAQMYLSAQQYDDAITTLKQWFELSPTKHAEAYFLLASTYAANHQYTHAITPARRVLELFTPPAEHHYRFLLGLYFETTQPLKATLLLENLILKFPHEKTYWLQLASLYSQQNRSQDSLAALNMAYQRELLTTSEEIVQLAQLLLHLQNPIKAAQILEQEINTGKVKSSHKNHALLASAWFNAREYQKALKPLQLAAQQSPSGDLYYRLAQAQFELEKYAAAIQHLELAQAKGPLKNPGSAHLLNAISHYQLERLDSAYRHFETALGFDSTKEQASQWLTYLRQTTR
ncbi:MAG: tetratricopeptide repeat protein [Pseudomonadales bacterium]|nr:tetratricopeptide repeat protein [Pseudomonadales bacterium]